MSGVVVQWRRDFVGVCLGALVLALSGGCTGSDAAAPGASAASTVAATPGLSQPAQPALPAASAGPTIAFVQDKTTLVLPDGRRISLSSVGGRVFRAYQTRAGWLFGVYADTPGPDGPCQLWLLKFDGSFHKLVDSAGYYPAVAPDGRRVAWVTGERMYTGHLTDVGALAADRTTAAPVLADPTIQPVGARRGYVVGYTGDTVYIGASQTGAGVGYRDTWVPTRGEYKPAWQKTTQVAAVYGLARDGRNLVGAVYSGNVAGYLCLALLDPFDSLAILRRNCDVRPAPGDLAGSLSLDGHWLVLSLAQASGEISIAILDQAIMFDHPVPEESCCLRSGAADDAGSWADGNTLYLAVHERDGRVIKVCPDRCLPLETVTLPGVSPQSDVLLITRVS